jgi:hypothetical protein
VSAEAGTPVMIPSDNATAAASSNAISFFVPF